MPVTVAGSFSNFNPQVNKMMEQLSKGYYGFMPSEVFTPNVNLYETETQYQVCVDLAGVEKDKIDIMTPASLGHDVTLRWMARSLRMTVFSPRPK